MEDLFKIILYSSFAGVTVFLGGLLSRYFERYFQDGLVKEEVLHTSIAFGGGIIIAAVAFVLVPEGMNVLPLVPMAILFLTGAIIFFFLDRYIEKKGGTISQLLAMLMDFVPEAIALGAVFATDHNLGLLLAIFIGLQNLPESFNSYLDLRNSGYTSKKCLRILLFLSFPGVLAAISGYCANVQIAEKLVSCTWRKLWFSCWNDRAKNIGITYPANKALHLDRFVAALHTSR